MAERPGSDPAADDPPSPRPARDQLFLEAVLDATMDGACRLLPDGTIRDWNRGAERILGWSSEEVDGVHFTAIFTEEVRPTLEWFLDIVASGDHIDRFELAATRKGGMPTPVAMSLRPLVDSAGIRGAAVILHDLVGLREWQAGDRLSAIEQWGLDEEGAMRNEFRHGLATIASGESKSGAAAFAQGAGRHGDGRTS